ncbi:MAG: NUDIX domain-containing protein [Myxococcota bacterium]
MNFPLPPIQLELVEDISPSAPPGFLRLVRRRLVAIYPSGERSAPFVYDEVDRRLLDAVVIVAHYVDAGGTRCVYLRSALRPPVVFRDRARSPVPELDPSSSIWELPAGLVEADEQTPTGVRISAARELAEELGFRVEPSALGELGASTFPCPGVIAERHFFFEIEVVPNERSEPELDGSALEREGLVISVPLAQAITMCDEGAIVDAKTELGLRRLAARAGGGA